MAIIQTNAVKKHKKRTSVNLEFANFSGGIRNDVVDSVLPIKYANKMYNFCIKNGALTTGLGISPLYFPAYAQDGESEIVWQFSNVPQRLYLFRAYNKVLNETGDRLMVYHNGGKLAWGFIHYNVGNYAVIGNLELSQAPDSAINYTLLDGKDAFIFGSPSDTLKYWTPTTQSVDIADAPNVTDMCCHYERIFATVSGKRTFIWFSDDLDPTNWTVSADAGGYIELTDKMYGGANRLISFNNYIFIFRDYGITRLSAYASQSSFWVQNIYASSNMIYANTVCVCGDLIYFMATDGFYAFDGVNVKKLKLGFENIIINSNNSYARATFYKNKYCIILDTTLAETKSEYLNTLITYDITSGEYDILAGYYFQDIMGLMSDKVERLIAIVKGADDLECVNAVVQIDESGQVGGVATQKLWESAY
ncbi:MAG: hypothetical protein ACI4TX_01665, partial [Christensenellales bacterium]